MKVIKSKNLFNRRR